MQLDGRAYNAAISGSVRALEALLIEDPNVVHAVAHGGWTPLMLALSMGQSEAASVLLRHSSDPNRRDYGGSTPLRLLLQFARAHGTQLDAMLRELIAAGADVNAVVDTGLNCWTPLHYAVDRRVVAAIPVLIEAGAKLDALDHKKRTPLEFARATGHAGVVVLLESRVTEAKELRKIA